MSEIGDFDPSSTPTVEVLVYRGDDLVTTEWCDSEDEAAEVVATWSERPGVRCVVRDLTARDATGPLEPDAGDEGPVENGAEDHTRAPEQPPEVEG